VRDAFIVKTRFSFKSIELKSGGNRQTQAPQAVISNDTVMVLDDTGHSTETERGKVCDIM
jgi:hypothetical protein